MLGPSFVVLLLCALVPAPASATDPARIAWLWDGAAMPAWSAPEAAVLTQNILLSDKHIFSRRRMRPAQLSFGTRVTPVVHIEVSTVRPPPDIERSRRVILGAVLAAARTSNSGWVQLDMEAHPSQRMFYRSLVAQLHTALPANIKLSVTALAWWCRAPAWLDGLAADEVVPMFFRMGKDSARLRTLIENDSILLDPRCRSGSAGMSPQEPYSSTVQQRYRRTYWFDYHAWKQVTPSEAP